MMICLKKIIVAIFIIIILFLNVSSKINGAVLTYGYGGYNIGTLPCICSGGLVWFTWFFPLHVNLLKNITGPMALGIPPTALWYAQWTVLIPTTWSMGKAVPIWTCWQPGITGCHPWPTFGHIYMAGSGLPGALP